MTALVLRALELATSCSLADVAAWAGLSYDTLHSWKLGRRTPSPSTVQQLAAGLRDRAMRLERMATSLERAASGQRERGR